MSEVSNNQEFNINCENCGAALNGQFCSVCGQEINSRIRYFGTVLLHVLDDVFSFDSRANRTLLPLIVKPGFLTQKYFEGKRVHYVPPIRLYLFISIIFFLSLKFFTSVGTHSVPMTSPEIMQQKISVALQGIESLPKSTENTQLSESMLGYAKDIEQDQNKFLQNMSLKLAYLELKKLKKVEEYTDEDKASYEGLQEKIKKLKGKELDATGDVSFIEISSHKDDGISFNFLSKELNLKLNEQVEILEAKAEDVSSSDPSKLVQQMISKLPQLMFVLLPIFALLLKIMYLFSNRLYMEHLTVALHSHSFIFFALLIIKLLEEVENGVKDYLPELTYVISIVSMLLVAWVPIYLFIMQKRVYKQGYLFSSVKYLLISFVYIMLMSFTAFIALIWGLIDI